MNHAAPRTVQVPREEQLMTVSAAGGTARVAGQINSWRQLSRFQKQIMKAIKDTDHGAQRFMADPARFLTDAGYGVSTPFARELRSLPQVRSTPRRAYDEVVAGRHPSCQLDLEIDSLRLPPSLASSDRTGGEI